MYESSILQDRIYILQHTRTWHHWQQFELEFGPVIDTGVTDLDCYTVLRSHHRSDWIRDCLIPERDAHAQYGGRADIAAITNSHVNVAGRPQDSKHQLLPRRSEEGLDNTQCREQNIRATIITTFIQWYLHCLPAIVWVWESDGYHPWLISSVSL